MKGFKTYLEINRQEEELFVEVLSYRPYRSNYSQNPELCAEDDYEEIEIQVTLCGVDITDELSEQDYEHIEQQAIEWVTL